MEFVEHNPEISIGLPTRNGGETFARLLDQVFAQESSRRCEVYALDSGSTDGTLDRLADRGVRVVPIDQATFNWGNVRERLFAEARGEIVINLSQDAVPAGRDWIDRMAAPFSDPEVAVVCGASIPDPDRAFDQFQWERNGYYYFTREIAKYTAKHGRGMSFANTAVRRRVWEELHIEPQATGEDFGFQMKLAAAGKRILFTDDAPVWHHHNYTLKGVYRRCRNEGLALREMGCAYNEADLIRDLLRVDKNVQWLREIRYGRLRTVAEWVYPVLRPVAVYHGSRFAREMVWY
jgi:rhamnosyltransferase